MSQQWRIHARIPVPQTYAQVAMRKYQREMQVPYQKF